MFTPEIGGNDPSFDEHIFEMGWFNHLAGFFFTHIMHPQGANSKESYNTMVQEKHYLGFSFCSPFQGLCNKHWEFGKRVNVLRGSFLWFLVAKYKIQAGKLSVGSRNPFTWWLKEELEGKSLQNCTDKSRIPKKMTAEIWFRVTCVFSCFFGWLWGRNTDVKDFGYSSSQNHESGEWVPTRTSFLYNRVISTSMIMQGRVPSRELTYPLPRQFWRWFSFSSGGIC